MQDPVIASAFASTTSFVVSQKSTILGFFTSIGLVILVIGVVKVAVNDASTKIAGAVCLQTLQSRNRAIRKWHDSIMNR